MLAPARERIRQGKFLPLLRASGQRAPHPILRPEEVLAIRHHPEDQLHREAGRVAVLDGLQRRAPGLPGGQAHLQVDADERGIGHHHQAEEAVEEGVLHLTCSVTLEQKGNPF